MQEIADASGLGRATVYRHFPPRADLVAALGARVGGEVAEVLGRALRDDDVEGALRRLATEAVAIGQRWMFLGAITDPAETTHEAVAHVERDFLAWVEAAQARGELVPADPLF